MADRAERQADRLGKPLRRVDDLYRLLIENVRDYAIFILDPEGRVASWNAGAERIKGYAEEEIVGRSYATFYPREAVEAGIPARQLEIAAREGRFEGEGWRIRKDGSRFWAHVVITALHDDGGTLAGFGKVTGDKTAERAAQEELRARERQLAEAQQIAHLGSWTYEVGRDEVLWSEELHRIFGIPTGTPLDLSVYAGLIHPEDRERVVAVIRESIRTGASYAFDHRIVRGDGEVRHVQSRGEPVMDDDGHVVRLVGTALDITEMKLAEEREHALATERALRAEAERSERRTRFVARASQLLGASLEYEETLRTVVRLAVPEFADWSAVDILGPDGALQRLAVAHVDPERVALAEELHRRYPPSPDRPNDPLYTVVRTGEPLILPRVTEDMLRSTGRDPEYVRLVRELGIRSAMIAPIRIRDRVLGAVTFITAESGRTYGDEDLAVARDLGIRAGLAIENAQLHTAERQARQRAEQATERMARLHEAEHEARQAAEAASRAKTQFLAMMSHELRTPLSAIIGYQELLSEGIVGPVTDRQREQLGRIRASAMHLRDLINQILSLSRIEAGKEEVAREALDLGELTREAALLLEQEADSKGIALRVHVPGEPVELTSDPAKLRQILLNLISNGLKFTDEGEVEVRLSVEGSGVVVTVRDTGIGIAPEDQERIFDAFTQVDQSMTRRAGGSGLGLPVSRKLAQLLGGDITVESEPGRGSTFRLSLPR